MTNEELIQYGINWDKALESRGDEPMSEARQFLASAIQALESQQWIPCSERLPSEEGKYLVTMYSGGMYEVDTSWFWIYDEGETDWNDFGVIAWREVPQPYREGDAE